MSSRRTAGSQGATGAPQKEEYSMKNLFTTMFGRNEGRIHNPAGSAATALSAAGAMRHLLVNLAGEMSE